MAFNVITTVESNSKYGGSDPSGFAYSPITQKLYFIVEYTSLVIIDNPLNLSSTFTKWTVTIPDSSAPNTTAFCFLKGYLYVGTANGLYRISETDITNRVSNWIKVSSTIKFGSAIGLGSDGRDLYRLDNARAVYKIDQGTWTQSLVLSLSGGYIHGTYMTQFTINDDYIVHGAGNSGVAYLYVYNRRTGVYINSIGIGIDDSADKVMSFKHMGKTYFGVSTVWGSDYVGILEATSSPEIDYFNTYYVSPPNTPSNTTPVISSKKFGDIVNVSWNSVPVPPQNGLNLDIQKVFYEVKYHPDGVNGIVIADGLESLNQQVKIIAGGSSNSKISIRSYVLYNSLRQYSTYTYTNTFTTEVPPSNTTLPNAVYFNGSDSYVTASNRIVPTTGPWTVEFSFKTTQSNGYLLSIDNGTSHVLLCQLSGGRLNVIVDGQGSSAGPFNDGKIHHVGIVQDSGVTSVYVDGILRYSITKTIPTFSPASLYLGMMGYNYTSNNKYNGILGLPRFWNTVRTVQQLKDYRGTIVPDNEPGLIDYLVFDPSTGLVKMKKNSYTIDINSISWIYLFIALENVQLPFPYDYQREENLTYLRNNVNEFRVNNGLDVKTWTDPVIVKGYTPIKAAHWNEVEGAILEVYISIGQNISSSEVEQQLNDPIVARDTRYPIKGLQQRINNIAKGLKNN